MFIHELARTTGVSAKTIRYYESIGLMPDPERAENNYRQYTSDAIERLRYIVSARSLGFSLTDIGEFLSARDVGTLPCQRVLDSFDQRIADIDLRIADLLALRGTLTRIRTLGEDLPANKNCDEQCVCYLITTDRENGQVTIQREEKV
ncbi:MAG: heavy metal-responsive transcriptional regulator [Chloroflexota bacterium]